MLWTVLPGHDGYREREVELEWSMLQVYCVINISNKSVLDQDNTGLWIILIYKWPGSSISAICFILWRRNRYHVNQVWKRSVVLWEHDGWILHEPVPASVAITLVSLPVFGKDNFERNRNVWNVVLFCGEYGVEITQKEVFPSKGCCEGAWVPASFLHLPSEKILQCDAYLFSVRPFNAGLL